MEPGQEPTMRPSPEANLSALSLDAGQEDFLLLNILKQEKDPKSPAHQAAWKTVADRFSGRIFKFALRFVRDSTVAEELVQDTFLAFYEALKKNAAPDRNLAGWLLGITAHKAIAVRRRAKAEAKRMERVKKENPITRSPAAADASKDEAQRTAAELLDRLPDKLRLPAILYFTCGLKQEEIAVEMRCSQAVVSARLRAALEKLRLGMQKKGFSSLPASLPVLLAAESMGTAVLSGRCMADLLAVPEKIAAGRKLAHSQSAAAAGGKFFAAIVVIIVVAAVATALAVRPIENHSSESPPPPHTNPSASESNPPKTAPSASIPEAADDEVKILLDWNFDGDFKEKLNVLFLPSMYETVDPKILAAATTRKTDAPADIAHLPDGGRSGGGLLLNNYRGFILPITPPDAPFFMSFHIKAKKAESTAAMGIHSHPDGKGFSMMRIFYGYDSDGNLYDPEEKKAPPSIEMPLGKWMRTERLCWFKGNNLMMAGWHENKLLMVCRYSEVEAGKDFRMHIGGHQMVLDDLFVRTLTKSEFDEKYAEIIRFLKNHSQFNKQ